MSIRAYHLELSSDSLFDSLTKLKLKEEPILIINGNIHRLASEMGPQLPFTQPRKMTLSVDEKCTTIRWLHFLAFQLVTSKELSSALSLYGDNDHHTNTTIADLIDFMPYTRPRTIRIAAKPNAGEGQSLLYHDASMARISFSDSYERGVCHQMDASIIQGFPSGIDEFLRDNAAPDMSTLSMIAITIDKRYMDLSRLQDQETIPPPPKGLAVLSYTKIEHKDGRVVRKLANGYIKTIAALRELMTMRGADLKRLEAQNSVTIDVSEVRTVVKGEDELAMVGKEIHTGRADKVQGDSRPQYGDS